MARVIAQEEEEHGLRVMEEELFELSSRAVEGGRRNLELSRKLVAVKTDERVRGRTQMEPR